MVNSDAEHVNDIRIEGFEPAPEANLLSEQTIIDIAYYVLSYCGTMDVNKLNMLLYHLQAWHLVNFSKPMFKGEFEARTFGPYNQEIAEHFGEANRTCILPNRDISTIVPREFEDAILDQYGHLSSDQLRAIIFRTLPWIDVEKKSPEDEPRIISQNDMKQYYQFISDWYSAKEKNV